MNSLLGRKSRLVYASIVGVVTGWFVLCGDGYSQTGGTLPLAITLPASEMLGAGVVLNGMARPNGLPTTVWFEWGTDLNYGNQTAPMTTNGNGGVQVTNLLTGLLKNQLYHYRVVASNIVGVAHGGDTQIACGTAVLGWGDNIYGQTNPPAGLKNVTALAANASDVLTLRSDGSLVAWGSSSYGLNIAPALALNTMAIAAGESHFMALSQTGIVYAWGNNANGQTKVPSGLSNVVAISGGWNHSLALKSDGTVTGWGDNSYGECTAPAGVSNLVAISAGGLFSVALKSDGTVTAWGEGTTRGSKAQSDVPGSLSNVVAISAGADNTLALRKDGTVVAWGSYDTTNIPAGLTNVVAISVGYGHSMALRSDGTIVEWGDLSLPIVPMPENASNVVGIADAWGDGTAGTLGLCAAMVSEAGPVQIGSLSAVISLGEYCYDTATSFVIVAPPLSSAGTLYQYDAGAAGAAITDNDTMVSDPLGRVVFVPAQGGLTASGCTLQFASTNAVSGFMTSTVSIIPAASAAAPFTITQSPTSITGSNAVLNGIVRPNGSVSAAWFEWGTDLTYGNQTAPVSINLDDMVQLTSLISGLSTNGSYHYRSVISNSVGVAHGADKQVFLGRKIAMGGASVMSIASNLVAVAGGYNSGSGVLDLALKNDGSVIAWGQNQYGQTNVPAGLSGVVAISAVLYHGLALKNDGTVVAWGNNTCGQCSVPGGLKGVVAISAGEYHSLALRNDGTVVAWGMNSNYQSTVPPNLSNVVAIAAGDYNSMALKNDGTVRVWGDNSFGQTNVPAAVTNVGAVAAGDYHCLALKLDGTTVSWGFVNSQSGPSNVVAVAAGGYQNLALMRDGTLAQWGMGYSPGDIITSLGSVLGIAQGIVVVNHIMPSAYQGTFNGLLNTNLTIGLSGSEPDGDPLAYIITTLPASGALYQYNDGAVGPAITAAGTVVSDPAGQVILVPAADGWGVPYTTFQFMVSDGTLDSSPAQVTINIANPPSANTLPTTAIGFTNATLNGIVIPNQLGVRVWYNVYGPTNDTTSSTTNIGSSTAAVAVPLTVTGLQPGATYHFEIMAEETQLFGDHFGGDMTFTTLALPTILPARGTVGAGKAFQLDFTGTAGCAFNAWASTNLTNWTWIGTATETSTGVF